MEKFRISLLTGIFGSIFFILVRTIITPAPGKTTATPFVFPTAVPLPEWELKNSRAIAASVTKNSSNLSGRRYQYIQNDLTLDIEMQYALNTKGDVKSFIQNYSSLPLSSRQLALILRQQQGIGFYSLFAYQQRAYLSSCINSQGGTTVTVSQFRQNRNIYDNIYNMRFKERLIPWLQGRGSIQDMRCLWTHLSIPLKNSAPEDAYQRLEKAWFSWYQWWHPRFPQP
jgi:cyanosortase A-associated protein